MRIHRSHYQLPVFGLMIVVSLVSQVIPVNIDNAVDTNDLNLNLTDDIVGLEREVCDVAHIWFDFSIDKCP